MNRPYVVPGLLAGLAEVAAELGCSKQQISALRRRADFPEPVVNLAATPIWDIRDIRHFKGEWTNRRKRLTSKA